MPKPLGFWDDETRAEHYLARAEQRGDCLCIGPGTYYPTWKKRSTKTTRGTITERLSQLICRVYHGARPNRAIVMHSCDNKACIRPEHISWGTYSKNNRDSVDKGRRIVPIPSPFERLRQGTHHWQRLTVNDANAIRTRALAGEKQASIAADFGITFQQVSKIKLNQRWAHLIDEVQ